MYIKPEETYEITLLFQLITRQFQDISNFSARRLKRGKKNLQSLTNILAAVALIMKTIKNITYQTKRTEP